MESIDAIRNFGNFAAHPLTDQTTPRILDVEPEEADWCLQPLSPCAPTAGVEEGGIGAHPRVPLAAPHAGW